MWGSGCDAACQNRRLCLILVGVVVIWIAWQAVMQALLCVVQNNCFSALLSLGHSIGVNGVAAVYCVAMYFSAHYARV
jgi:hypothetical protein